MTDKKTQEEKDLPEYAHLDINAKKILRQVNVLMLIFRGLIDEFEDMSDEALMALLEPVKDGLENISPIIRESNPELDHKDQKRILDLLYLVAREGKPKMFVDIELQSTKEQHVEIRSVQYITALLGKTTFVNDELDKVILIWVNMAPPKREEGTILVNPPLLFDRVTQSYWPRKALNVCPTVIQLNLYDIRKDREEEIREEGTDVIAILSTIFSKKIDHKKKDAILKERKFTLNQENEMEMKDMESWSKGIFESMRDDIAKEVREEILNEGLIEGREKGREEGMAKGREEGFDDGIAESADIFALFAEGKSDEEVLQVFPKLTLMSVKKARQGFEKLKVKMNLG